MSARFSEHATHAGFAAVIDPAAARHQLRMSAGVVVVLILAVATSLFAFRPGQGQTTAGLQLQPAVFAAVPASSRDGTVERGI